MNQIAIGRFIAQKRKEKNLTQDQLAEKIGISNKTISKWECGKSMPDYSLIRVLCQELEVEIAELMNGEMSDHRTPQLDNQQLLEMLERIQRLEKEKQTMFGFLLIIMGISMSAVSQLTGGTDFKDFISGVILGLSIGIMLVGIYMTAQSIAKQ